MRPGATWVEMSTLGRDDVLRLAGIAAEAGVRMLELPVTGGVHLAARGEITMLPGGDADLVDLHRPALDAMGNRVFHMGPLGSSAIIKVITNMLAFIHLKATSEALMLAKRGGLDLAQAWHAIAASSGNSFVHETEGALILNGSYDIAFSVDLALEGPWLCAGLRAGIRRAARPCRDDRANLCRGAGGLWRRGAVTDDREVTRRHAWHRSSSRWLPRAAGIVATRLVAMVTARSLTGWSYPPDGDGDE